MMANALPKSERLEFEVSLQGRDRASLCLEVSGGTIQTASLKGSGCTEFLRALAAYRPFLRGALADLPVPTGISHSDILLREAILKAKGQWVFPYPEEELCHCRAVATAKVDAAIIGGCRSVRAIARETSAGTSCGSCRPDTEAIIAYRLGES